MSEVYIEALRAYSEALETVIEHSLENVEAAVRMHHGSLEMGELNGESLMRVMRVLEDARRS